MLHRSEAVISKKEAGVLEYDLFLQEDVINTFQLIILHQTNHLQRGLVSLEDAQDFTPNFRLDSDHRAGWVVAAKCPTCLR